MPVAMTPIAASDDIGASQFNTIAPTSVGVSTPSMTREQYDAVSMKVYNRVNQADVGVGAWEHVGRWALGTAIDTADTMWSTPLNPFGDRGDIWQYASTEQKDYYDRHKGLIEGSSAVAGGIMTLVAAEALVIPKITSGLAASTALTGTRVWRAAEKWNEATRVGMLSAQRAAAESGEAFGLWSTSAGRQYLANQAAKGVYNVNRTLPFEYAMMWNNDAFNSHDAATEGLWIGAGIVLGGTLGAIGARAAVRASANSAEIRDLRAAPYGYSGVMNDFLAPVSEDALKRVDTGRVQLKDSAKLTDLMVMSRSNTPGGYEAPAAVAARLDHSRDVWKQLAEDQMQKIVNKGNPGVKSVKGPAAAIPEIKNIFDKLYKEDPFMFHGMDSAGVITGSLKTARDERAAHLTQLWNQQKLANERGLTKEAQRLAIQQRVLKNQDEFVMINGNWLHPDSELAKAAADHRPERVKFQFLNRKQGETIEVLLPSQGKVFLDASLTPRGGRSQAINVEKMSIGDRLHLNEAAVSLVKEMTRKDAKVRFKLTDDAAKNWFTLDLASSILERGGNIEFATKKLKLSTIEDLQRESLRLKSRKVLSEVGDTGRITDEIRFRYNLPSSTPMEKIEDSAGDGFRAWLIGAARDDGTSREFGQALTDYRAITGIDLLPANGAPYARVDGDMLNYNRDGKGTWMRPMLAYFDRRSNIEKISRNGHNNAMTLRKAERTRLILEGQNQVGLLAQRLVQMPEFQRGMNVKGMHNEQVTGGGGGLGQMVGELLPFRFKNRDQEQILDVTKLQEETERFANATFKAMMDDTQMQQSITQITSSGHAPQRVMLDQYFSLAGGWDIAEATPLGNGKFGFLLEDTAANRNRLGMSATDKWEYNLLQNQRLEKPIVVDETALGIIKQFEVLTNQVRDGDNTLRAAKGLEPIAYRKNFVPSPDTKGARVGFVMGPDGKVVPGRTIVARSEEEYTKLSRRTLEDLGDGNGYTIKTREQLEALRDVWDEVGLDWINPGFHPATAGIGSQKGGLVGAYVKEGAFFEALDWVKRKTMVQSQDTLRQLYEEPLMVARAFAETERVMNPGKRSIWDTYEKALTGQSQGYSDTAILDKGLRKVEESLNSALASSAITAPVRWIIDAAQRIGMDPTDLYGKKTYRAIAESMGDYTPYAHVSEYTESRGIKRPPTIKGMSQKFNTLAASVLLRWLELPHAMMNMAGLISTMPASVMAGKAPISTFVSVKGQQVGALDSAKIISDGMKDMFSKRRKADWEHMVKFGDAEQSVKEYHEAMAAIDSQAGFMKFAKKIDKYVSLASEKSESWSRQTAHFIGLRLADYHGIKGMEARHNFAREIANSAIADYAPINRPELFQSGFGSMFGLFQSYALNHYTRMFRWMEKGDYKNAGIQAAMQATMFGVPGTYGMGHLMDLRDSLTADGGEPTALDLIYEHYGPVLGGAIAHGGVSQVTQLALWTRGDSNFRVPGANGSLPVVDIGTKVARGFVDSMGAFMNAQTTSEGLHGALEAWQSNMPNRVMKSWLTLLNGGKEIDAYGQTMVSTQHWTDTVARTLGVRSARQQSELEAYYAGRGAMERDAAKMESVRKSFRSAVRWHGGDVSKVDPIQYFNDYVAAGGNPRLFKTWARNLLRDSDSPRAIKSLNNAMATPRSALESWRFPAYGAWDLN